MSVLHHHDNPRNIQLLACIVLVVYVLGWGLTRFCRPLLSIGAGQPDCQGSGVVVVVPEGFEGPGAGVGSL